MPRVKGGTISRARHKKVMKQAKGYFGSKHRLFKSANEQVMHSGKYAYRDRRQKKRDFRKQKPRGARLENRNEKIKS